jgi:amino acid adenylation domain-containing protein
MIGHYKQLLQSIVAEPGQKTGLLQMLTQDEEYQLLVEFNDSAADYPKDKTLVDLFEEQVGKTPDNIALLFENEQWTFRELDERSNQLAYYLRSKGVREESLVPLCIERSMQMVVGILGILKAGAAYIPISPEYPSARIDYILKNLNAPLIVCSAKSKEGITDSNQYEFIEMDESLQILDSQPQNNIKTGLKAHHLAYIIYTSGSTGKPKGVLVEHQSIVNYLLTNIDSYIIRSEEGSGSFIHMSFTFDASLAPLFMPILSGKSIVIASNESTEAFKDPLFLKHAPYDFINLTPSHLQLLKEIIISEDILLARKLVIGGEALQLNHINFLNEACKDIEIVNEYGPTEATIGCLSFPFNITDAYKFTNGKIPIGSPMPNTRCYILDKNRCLVPIGVGGELYVSGEGLARGYLGLPELTAEKFIPDPFSSGSRMYSTGDICRWMPDGNIEYLERKDNQVKIRGYRIELGEIENALQGCDLVKNSAILAREDKEGYKQLIGYIVPNKIFDPEGITTYLKKILPEYMVPGLWMEIQQLPISLNGKIDKNALPEFDISELLKKQYMAPGNEAESALAEIWQESLGIERIGINDNFFELGGHSLMAVQIITKTEQKLGKKLPLSILFKHPTIHSLLSFIEVANVDTTRKSLVPIKASGTKAPVYIIHGSGLNVLNFSNIALHVDAGQPVFGLQAKGLDGSEDPLDDMKEIARSYIKEIIEHNPTGPYAIAGYSFGGYVAVEMRNQLELMGKKVKMLAIFDTNAVDSDYYEKWHGRLFKKVRRQFPKFLWILKSLITRPRITLNYQGKLVMKLFKSAAKKFIKSNKVESNDFYSRMDKINKMHCVSFQGQRPRVLCE